MIGFSLKVRGADQVRAKLQGLDRITSVNAMTKAALEGAEVIREEIAARAPRDTGLLSQNIRKVAFRRRKARVVVAIGPDPKRVKHGWFQEYGTIHHPAQPFMRPALDTCGNQAIEVTSAAMRRNIEGAAR